MISEATSLSHLGKRAQPLPTFPFLPSSPRPLRPGVPLSTQWGPQGYFYAIQISQYGLSHYSKNLTERAPHVELYDTAEERDSRAGGAPWSVAKGCSLSRVYEKSRGSSVRQFSAPGEHVPRRPDSLRGLRGEEGREAAYLLLTAAVEGSIFSCTLRAGR